MRCCVVMRILLAFDSFKGSLTSRDAAEAFALGVKDVAPECDIESLVLADGGEGWVDVLAETMVAEYVTLGVHDPLGRPVDARYALSGDIAIMEVSAAAGITLLSPAERNPLLTTTRGVGEMVSDALARGCRKVILGLGGSATNDAGVGMLSALGFRFLDSEGYEVAGCGGELLRIAAIDDGRVESAVRDTQFIVACDVNNPLVGGNGAAYIYARQKGADDVQVELLDRGLCHFAEVVRRYNGADIATLSGAGAAGGMGGGCYALVGAQLKSGIDIALDVQHFDERVACCDMVVTGEGRIDQQTLMGKTAAGVLRAAQRRGKPVIAVGGSVEWCDELRRSGFEAIYAATPEGMALDVAMREDVARENIRRVAREIVW